MTDDSSGTTNRRRFLSAAVAVGGSALLGTRFAGTAAGGGDGTRTVSTSRSAVDGDTFVSEWKRSMPDWGSWISPTVTEVADQGTVVIDAPAGIGLRAYGYPDGSRLWETELSGLTGAGPTVVDGVAYVASDGETAALDAATGEKRWSYDEQGGSLGVAVHDDLAIVPNGPATPMGSNSYTPRGIERTMRAFTREGGSIVWEQSFDTDGDDESEQFRTEPVVVDGTLYVGGDMGLVAMDPTTGEVQWQALESSYVGAMTIVDGVAYAVVDGLLAFDLETQETLWTADVQGGSPYYHDGSVYVVEKQLDGLPEVLETGVASVDAASGEVEWTRNTWTDASTTKDAALMPTTPAIVSNDQLVFGAARTSEGQGQRPAIFGLDLDSGDVETHWWPAVPEETYPDGDEPYALSWYKGAPTPVGDHLLISNYDAMRQDPRPPALQKLEWTSSPPGDGPKTPNPTQSGGCRVEDGTRYVGMQAYPDQDESYGDLDAYLWDVMDDGDVDEIGDRAAFVPFPENTSGEVTTSLTVRDRYGRTASSTVSFVPQKACSSYDLTMDPEVPETDEEVTFTVGIANGDASEYEFDWDVKGNYDRTQEPTYTVTYEDAGFYTAGVTVRSDTGDTTDLEIDFKVVCAEKN